VTRTGAEVIITDDAGARAEQVAAIQTYLSPQQVLSSPTILIGTPDEIATQILERAEILGLTWYVMRGAAPEEPGLIIARVRANASSGGCSGIPAEAPVILLLLQFSEYNLQDLSSRSLRPVR
jgi:hypothetical protein